MEKTEIPKLKNALAEKYEKLNNDQHQKEVETGANGTQDYVIKKGENKDKIAKK